MRGTRAAMAADVTSSITTGLLQVVASNTEFSSSTTYSELLLGLRCFLPR